MPSVHRQMISGLRISAVDLRGTLSLKIKVITQSPFVVICRNCNDNVSEFDCNGRKASHFVLLGTMGSDSGSIFPKSHWLW